MELTLGRLQRSKRENQPQHRQRGVEEEKRARWSQRTSKNSSATPRLFGRSDYVITSIGSHMRLKTNNVLTIFSPIDALRIGILYLNNFQGLFIGRRAKH